MKPSKMEEPLRLARPLTGEVQGESSGAWSVHTRSKFSTLSWPLQLGLKGDLTWRSRLVSILGSCASWTSVNGVTPNVEWLCRRPPACTGPQCPAGWLYKLAGPGVSTVQLAAALHL